MTYFLLYNSGTEANPKWSVGGTSSFSMRPESCPHRFRLFEGPDLPPEFVYWDGTKIVQKPQQPANSNWDNTSNTWVANSITPTTPPPATGITNDWEALYKALLGSAEWTKAQQAAAATLKANVAYTNLNSVVTVLKQLDMFVGAIGKMREAMASIANVGDFTAAEITAFNKKLKDAGFASAVYLK